ncbi:hypothetical protein BH11PSE3_BH11PSE3_23740 [soil metagenome]
MSHTLTLNKDLGVIVLRAKQPMSFNEIRLVFKEMVRLPGFRKGLCLVADFRATGTEITADDVRGLAHQARETDSDWGDTKWSIIASDDLLYGLSRMFGTLTDNHQVTTQVFRDVASADGWLGIGVETSEILARTPDV